MKVRFLPASTATCMKSRRAPNRPRTVVTHTDQTWDTSYECLTDRIIISRTDGYLFVCQQNDKKSLGTASPEDSGAVSRRPSQRQQEKAPEGRAPHSVVEGAADADADAPEADGAGPIEDGNVVGTAGADSRFHESL